MALTKVIGRGLGVQGDTVTGDDAALGFTSAEGLIITGQGTTGDVTIKNDADALVAFVPTGTDDLRFPDNAQLQLGAGGNDLALYHDGSNNFIYGNNAHNLQMYTAGNLALKIDTNGIITKPLQPAFQAKPASNQNNLAVSTEVNILFGTEIFDNNSDYDGSFIFTAPVTGKYHFSGLVRLGAIDSASEYYIIRLRTSNRDRDFIYDSNEFSSDQDYVSFPFAITTDMDASDQAYVRFYQNSGTAQTDVDASSVFSGHLVC